MPASILRVDDDRIWYIPAYYENVLLKSYVVTYNQRMLCFMIRDFLAGDSVTQYVTFGHFMTGNILAWDFLTRIHRTYSNVLRNVKSWVNDLFSFVGIQPNEEGPSTAEK